MQLDQTDWQIIRILTEQHKTNSDIARQLKLSEGAVRQRIKKLTESDALRVRALRNPNVLDNQQLAFVMIGVSEARLLDCKAQEIAHLENVLAVSIISGQYDLLVEILVGSNRGLVEFLTKDLASIDGITKTESLIVLKSYNKFI
ncbi:MAG: Lrp/AsnC family transcriptional regulator [Sedimentisphaerales bacterium]|nr:Lrp/AsnC family transcriptional regulator [Sedimentisphaerales bacterium]